MGIWRIISGEFFLSILIQLGYFIILSSSLNLIMGYGGMFNIGQGAFFAVGSYVSALVATRIGLPLIVEIIIACTASALLGLIVGIPSIRLKGDYLSFLTYGCAVTVHTIAKQWVPITKGDTGISGIPKIVLFRFGNLGGIRLTQSWMMLVFTLITVLISLFIIGRITNSPYGKSVESIREDEIAALACGRNVARIRVTIFTVGAIFAGVAGVIYSHYMGVVDPTGFTTTVSFNLVSMVLIGGLGSFQGAISGAVILATMPELLRLINSISGMGLPIEHIKNIIFSVLLIIIILKRPQGLFGKLGI